MFYPFVLSFLAFDVEVLVQVRSLVSFGLVCSFSFLRSSTEMSTGWEAYITSMTESSPAIKRAAIVSLDGSIWARTQGANAFKVGAFHGSDPHLVMLAREIRWQMCHVVFISIVNGSIRSLSRHFRTSEAPTTICFWHSRGCSAPWRLLRAVLSILERR